MQVETIRIPKEGRDQLIMLKRRTGIENWNVLCRWAFSASLAEPTRPVRDDSHGGGERCVEMTWRTFAGGYSDVYMALLSDRCHQDGIPLTKENLAEQLHLHLQRGIGYLGGDPRVTDIASLIRIGTRP